MLGERLNTSIYNLKEWDYHGLIGVETATAYWGLSTFSPDFTILLWNDNNCEKEDGVQIDFGLSTLFVPNVNTENVVHLSENLTVTDLEQTVCDMVRYNRHEFHLYETLISAIDEKMANLERLEKLARGYGIWEKMQEQLKQALIAYEEDANA